MIIDGKKLAAQTLKELKGEIQKKHFKLKLAAILAGGSAGLKKFVELKKKAAESIDVGFDLYEFPENVSEKKLLMAVKNISEAKNINGILVELPLPGHFNRQKILNAIPVEKDVDVLSSEAQEKFYKGTFGKLSASDFQVLPPAVEAVKIILEKHKIVFKNKNIVVFGLGILVGKPTAYWFSKMGAKVSVVDEFTKNPEKYSKKADIIVSGVGKPNLISGEIVKDGVIVFDFGYGNIGGKIVGDVDFKSVSKKAKLITPVPGGVGPIVVAAVLKNLVKLSKDREK